MDDVPDKHPTSPPCSATPTKIVCTEFLCRLPGYNGHAWWIPCPQLQSKHTAHQVHNPLARRYSPCPLPSSPFVHHLLHPLSLAVGLPPPSCRAPLPLVPLSFVFPVGPPSRCHPCCLPSSLLWVTVTVT